MLGVSMQIMGKNLKEKKNQRFSLQGVGSTVYRHEVLS